MAVGKAIHEDLWNLPWGLPAPTRGSTASSPGLSRYGAVRDPSARRLWGEPGRARLWVALAGLSR